MSPARQVASVEFLIALAEGRKLKPKPEVLAYAIEGAKVALATLQELGAGNNAQTQKDQIERT